MDSVKSFEDLLSRVEAFQYVTETPWYRGCSKLTYDLLPKIARGPKGTRKFAEIRPNENRMYREFRERAKLHLTGHADDEWDNMFMMQHYGVPTRLLDWSESPFVAMFFALRPRKGGYTDDPVVWMVDPVKWNSAIMPFTEEEDKVLDKSHRRLADYGFGKEFEQYRDEPLMMKGSYNSPRIVAQRGCFTIFGKMFKSLQEFIDHLEGMPNEVMQSIVIDKDYAPSVFLSLIKKGITETFVYPDMEGLSLEVARKHGFSDGQ